MIQKYVIEFQVEVPETFESIIEVLNQQEEEYDTYKTDRDQDEDQERVSKRDSKRKSNSIESRKHTSRSQSSKILLDMGSAKKMSSKSKTRSLRSQGKRSLQSSIIQAKSNVLLAQSLPISRNAQHDITQPITINFGNVNHFPNIQKTFSHEQQQHAITPSSLLNPNNINLPNQNHTQFLTHSQQQNENIEQLFENFPSSNNNSSKNNKKQNKYNKNDYVNSQEILLPTNKNKDQQHEENMVSFQVPGRHSLQQHLLQRIQYYDSQVGSENQIAKTHTQYGKQHADIDSVEQIEQKSESRKMISQNHEEQYMNIIDQYIQEQIIQQQYEQQKSTTSKVLILPQINQNLKPNAQHIINSNSSRNPQIQPPSPSHRPSQSSAQPSHQNDPTLTNRSIQKPPALDKRNNIISIQHLPQMSNSQLPQLASFVGGQKHLSLNPNVIHHHFEQPLQNNMNYPSRHDQLSNRRYPNSSIVGHVPKSIPKITFNIMSPNNSSDANRYSHKSVDINQIPQNSLSINNIIHQQSQPGKRLGNKKQTIISNYYATASQGSQILNSSQYPMGNQSIIEYSHVLEKNSGFQGFRIGSTVEDKRFNHHHSNEMEPYHHHQHQTVNFIFTNPQQEYYSPQKFENLNYGVNNIRPIILNQPHSTPIGGGIQTIPEQNQTESMDFSKKPSKDIEKQSQKTNMYYQVPHQLTQQQEQEKFTKNINFDLDNNQRLQISIKKQNPSSGLHKYYSSGNDHQHANDNDHVNAHGDYVVQQFPPPPHLHQNISSIRPSYYSKNSSQYPQNPKLQSSASPITSNYNNSRRNSIYGKNTQNGNGNNKSYRFVQSIQENRAISNYQDGMEMMDMEYDEVRENGGNNDNNNGNGNNFLLVHNKSGNIRQNAKSGIYNSRSNRQQSQLGQSNRQNQRPMHPITGRTVVITNYNESQGQIRTDSEKQSLVDHTYKSYDKWKDTSKIVYMGGNHFDQPFDQNQYFKIQGNNNNFRNLNQFDRHATHRKLVKSSIQGNNSYQFLRFNTNTDKKIIDHFDSRNYQFLNVQGHHNNNNSSVFNKVNDLLSNEKTEQPPISINDFGLKQNQQIDEEILKDLKLIVHRQQLLLSK